MNLFKPFHALTFPILPLVPDCTYCAAMRFALLSAVLAGAISAGWHGALVGLGVGAVIVLLLYLDYKSTEV